VSFELAVQSAIYNALINHAPLMDAVPGVFDDVAQDYEDFPYVTIGEAQHAANDTDTTLCEIVTASVHVWSRKSGRAETKTIQGFIFDALNRASLTASGYRFHDCTRLGSQSFIDADGITRHGVQQFKIYITAN
jgi:hypothetical protein